MSAKLTIKQQIVYDFLKQEIKRNGYSPSVREICDGVGLSSTSTVHAHLEILKKKGYIKRLPSKNRTIEVLEEGFYTAHRDYVSVPIVSSVPVDGFAAKDNITGAYMVPQSYVGDGACFMYALDEDDDAEKIKAGDFALVKLQENVKSGDLVILNKSGKTLLKKYKNKRDGKVIGKVAAIIRRY